MRSQRRETRELECHEHGRCGVYSGYGKAVVLGDYEGEKGRSCEGITKSEIEKKVGDQILNVRPNLFTTCLEFRPWV